MIPKWSLAAVAAVLCACGAGPSQQQTPGAAAAVATKPADQSRRFPLADQISMRLVTNHLLGKDFLPGGNVAEYQRRGKTYQQFLVHSKSAEDAALLLFDFKEHLRDTKYLAHMGGYFGKDDSSPVYVFQKGSYLAGLVGLPEREADVLARQFAARLE